jgi:hypothetical protein
LDVERIEGLHPVEVARVEKRLAQRGHPEVDEGAPQLGVAEAALSHQCLLQGCAPHPSTPGELALAPSS